MDLLFGQNMGVNVDDMTMDQKRRLYGSMFDPMEAGRERLRAMTAPEATSPIEMNPLLAQAILGGSAGLLSPQQPQFMPMVRQQATPGFLGFKNSKLPLSIAASMSCLLVTF